MADIKTTELQTQLDLNNQINELLMSRMNVLKAQEKVLSNQVQYAVDMCKALKCEELDEVSTRLDNMRKELEKAADSAGSLGNEIEDAADRGSRSMQNVDSEVKSQTKSFSVLKGAVAGAVVGLVRGFGSVYQTLTNLTTGVSGLIGTFFNLGTAIIGLPFKLLEGLFSVAQGSMSGSPSPLKIELENIRREFGDLSVATGKTAASAMEQFQRSAGNLGGTGLALRRIFGSGPEGVAKAMAENLELMKALGPAADNFNDILQNSAGELTAFRKGLGLTVEQQGRFMKFAQAAGKDPMKEMNKFASQAINMGESFGISSKLISKDMAEMQGDFANFGGLGPKVMSQISVYTRKLGIEIKSLTGLISAFDDFEGAAQGAAKLSQAFGMNVDAMKMMQEQDPAARLSMLQKAFKDTGRSIDTMTRQEKKLLAQQAGLDDEAAALAFSQRGLSMSYDQVQKQGEKAQKKQLTQVQVMDKLAKSIERVVETMQQTQFTGFFDAFSKGFMSGIEKSKEFKQIMRAVTASLMIVFRAGKEVGKLFMMLFPGISDLSDALTALFSPERYSDLMIQVKSVFSDFFTDLKTDPKAGVEKFIDRFKKIFTDFFKSGGKLTGAILDGGKTILNTFKEIFIALLPIALRGLIDLIKYITDFLKDPPQLDSSIGKLFGELAASMIDLASKLWEQLWPPMKEMFITVFEKIKPWLKSAAPWLLGAALVKMVLSAIMSAAWGAVTTALTNVFLGIFGQSATEVGTGGFFRTITKMLTEGLPKLGSKLTAAVADMLGPSLSAGFSRAAAGLSKLAGPVAIAVAVGTIGMSVSKLADSIGPDLESKFGKTAMQAGISAASVIDAITLGLLPDSLIKDIAEFFAKVTHTVEKWMEKLLPKEVVEMFRAQIAETFGIFQGIGEILRGVFEVSPDAVAKGFGKIFDAILDKIIVFTINLPKLVWKGLLKFGEFVVKGTLAVITWLATDGLWYLGEALVGLMTLISGLGLYIWDKLKEAFEFAMRLFTDGEFRGRMWDKVWNFGRDIVMGIIDGLWNFGIMLGDTMYDAWTKFKDFWKEKTGVDMGKIAQSIIDKFVAGVSGFKDKVVEVFQRGWNAVTGFFDLSKLTGLGSTIIDGIISIVTFFPSRMLSLAQTAWDKFSDVFNLSELVDFAHETIDGIVDTLIDFLPFRYGVVARLAWSSMSDYFSIDKLKGLGSGIVDGILEGLSGLKDKFLETVTGAWNAVAEFFGWNSPATEGVGLGKGIMDGIINGIDDLIPNMLKPFDTAFTKIIEAAQNGMKKIVSAIADSFNSIVNTIAQSGIVGKMSDLLGSIASSFISSFTSSFNTAIRLASTGLTTLKGLMQISTLGEESVQALRVFARSITMIVTELSEVVSPDTNVTERIEKLSKAINKVSKEISNLGNDENSALAVEVGKSLSGNGKLTIRHETTNINLAVDIKMSAEQIGKGVIKWSDGATPAAGNGQHRRFATINRANDTVPDNLNTPGTGLRDT